MRNAVRVLLEVVGHIHTLNNVKKYKIIIKVNARNSIFHTLGYVYSYFHKKTQCEFWEAFFQRNILDSIKSIKA
jgi:hypothetical protein